MHIRSHHATPDKSVRHGKLMGNFVRSSPLNRCR